jgi:UDP-glucose 4-epimerase
VEREAAALSLALVVSVGLTALAVRAGHRYRLFDYPTGWKQHTTPTPYIGGVAVLLAFLLTGPALAGDLDRLWPLAAGALVLGAVGLRDDRRGLPAKLRVALEAGAGALLWATDLGWSVFGSDLANLALTSVWVVGLVNALNLLDLMDGVAGSVAAVSALGIGVLAAVNDDTALAVLAFAVAGACAGFLVHNMRSPARIYLGDCGTMSIGLLLAGMISAQPIDARSGWAILLGAVPLLGVPLFDMALRIVLRLRRRISLMTGGQDSVANWLCGELGTPRRVAVLLAAVQALLCALAIAALEASDAAVMSLSAVLAAAGVVVATVVIGSPWAHEADERARLDATEAVPAPAGASVIPLRRGPARPRRVPLRPGVRRPEAPGRRYLVTGGAGFVGSTVVDLLVGRGDQVLVLDDLSTGRRENLGRHAGGHAVQLVEGSVLDEALVDDCMGSTDVCLHLAAAVGEPVASQPLRSLIANVRGTDVVISAAARHDRRLLFASTSEIYGKSPLSALTEDADRVLGSPFHSRWSYSTAKAFGEALAHEYHRERGAQNTVVRIFDTVGPRQTGAYGMVLRHFVRRALADEDLTVYGTGAQRRCFLDVRDAAAAIALLCDAEPAHGEVFNIGSTSPVTTLDLAAKVIERTGSAAKIRLASYAEAVDDGFEEPPRRRPDCSRIEEVTGWRPTRTLDETIDDVVAYERGLGDEDVVWGTPTPAGGVEELV